MQVLRATRLHQLLRVLLVLPVFPVERIRQCLRLGPEPSRHQQVLDFQCHQKGPAFQLQAIRCREARAHRCLQVVLHPVPALAVQEPEPFPEQGSPVALKAKELRKARSLNRGPPSSPPSPS